ncbi:MAG: PEP-CTERM sorting domain-containing protein [Desulfarculaceae bacterium]|nr:PEP-CTERM sorting domain-containing protein [Desulfarculaceae bacterium]MCF8074495.1 PEP-CTERM sorting domain-containing protein [Desulfarculaceae bacterium]MCF8103594.1 PEP-CTERM sorting domain-containing protein [Desulfarculaceae bacterium]MCF8118384.1 PEP-CTERM sorting domain-containing protein [Desulfarculaceae bacterium]
MKRFSLLVMLLAVVALAAPAAADLEDMISIVNRFGDASHGNDWELGVLPGGDISQSPMSGTTHDYGWVESMPQQFTLKYDPQTGLLEYTIGGKTMTTTFFSPQSAESFALEIVGGANSMAGEVSSVMVDYLTVNGQQVNGQMYARSGQGPTDSLVLQNLPKDGFTITGELTMKTNHQVVQTSQRHPGHSNPHGHAYGHNAQTNIVSLGGNLVTAFNLKADVPQLPLQGGGQAAAPEPGTMLLLGSGLAGLAAWRARRRKKG